MHPLFTVHAGELLVGDKIESEFPTLRVWIPSKDTGVDLLVTDEDMQRTVSLQVKMSRDYSHVHSGDRLGRELVATGWTVIKRDKLASSSAEFWVFVLVPLEHSVRPRFLVIRPAELLENLTGTFGERTSFHLYPWLLKDGRCVNGRGLKKAEREAVADGTFQLGPRDLTACLEDWECLRDLADGHS